MIVNGSKESFNTTSSVTTSSLISPISPTSPITQPPYHECNLWIYTYIYIIRLLTRLSFEEILKFLTIEFIRLEVYLN